MLLRPIIPLLALLLAFALQPTARAEDASRADVRVEIKGISLAPVSLTSEMLSALPAIERDVTFETSKGLSSGHYRGVLLWDVLQFLKAFEGLEHNGELRKTFVVQASDQYEIAFSVGEIHPQFGNTPVILVTHIDGKPIYGLRLVVPGDKRGARAVRDVTSIEVR